MTCTMPSVREQGPGLRALFPAAVMLSPRTTSPARFLHLRSISPGHRITSQVIRGKCWIASRSRSAGTSRAQGPEMADSQGPEGPGSPDLGPFLTPDPAIWDPDPGIRTPDPGHLGPGSGPSRTARIPGSWDPGEFCQKCRLGQPESELFPEMAGKGQFRACPELAMSGQPSARAELKSSVSTLCRSVETGIPGGFHSV